MEETNDYSENAEQPKASKPFFRRLSFKGLRKGKVTYPVPTNELNSNVYRYASSVSIQLCKMDRV